MFIQFRHVGFNESFAFPPRCKEAIMYIKWNHGRGKEDPIRKSLQPRAKYRYFKPNTVVLVGDKETDENRFMSVPENKVPCCNNTRVLPFDNDKQCVNCGHIGRKQ